jgi:uncharacterized integral membrane protein
MVFIYVILGALGLLVIVLFSVQNAAPVTVWFYNWTFNASLAIVVFLSVIAGMVIEGFFIASLGLRRGIRRRRKNTFMSKEEQNQPSKSDLPPPIGSGP